MIAERYRAVVARAAEAALRAGRQPEEVTVLVAAKTFDAAAIREVVRAGGRDVGENYVQEAARKASELSIEVEGLRWHMIGRLQRNKASVAAKLFHLIHSVDRIELARSLDRAAREKGSPVRALVEVNLVGEVTKGGVEPGTLERFLGELATLDHVRVEGLMTIPPPGSPDASRRAFARLRELGLALSRLRLPNVQLKELSMGMSGDFEEAIAEGATIVRVGTAVFGPRS